MSVSVRQRVSVGKEFEAFRSGPALAAIPVYPNPKPGARSARSARSAPESSGEQARLQTSALTKRRRDDLVTGLGVSGMRRTARVSRCIRFAPRSPGGSPRGRL